MRGTPKITHCPHQFTCKIVDRAHNEAIATAAALVRAQGHPTTPTVNELLEKAAQAIEAQKK